MSAQHTPVVPPSLGELMRAAAADREFPVIVGQSAFWGLSAEYTAGIGWQYRLTRSDVLFGRYGNFETEGAALREGLAAIAKITRGKA